MRLPEDQILNVNIIFRRQDGFIPLLKTKFLREAQSPTKAGA